MGKVQKSVILSGIHHRQNPLGSIRSSLFPNKSISLQRALTAEAFLSEGNYLLAVLLKMKYESGIASKIQPCTLPQRREGLTGEE
jgi:hypothetical protein